MVEINIKKMILKYGEKPVLTGARTTENTVVCQGCGKPIKSTETDLQNNVGFVMTKRGTAYFFHNKCFGKVWNSPIRSLKE